MFANSGQTWAAFIKHFDDEYKELLKLRGPTMQSSNLHEANALVETLKNFVESTVAASIKRHVANATFNTNGNTFNTNGNQGTINNATNLPPQLQNPYQVTRFTKFCQNMSQMLQE